MQNNSLTQYIELFDQNREAIESHSPAAMNRLRPDALSALHRFGRLPVTFADRASLPTAGVFFCPEYGEAYYEIYLGNHSNLAHFGWWGNCFGIDNHLTMTLHFRNRRSLALGYRLYVRTNHANNLTNQYVRNAFTVAIQIN